MSWISVNDELPETRQRVLARFETTFNDKQLAHVTITNYVAPRSILESDFMDEDFAGSGDYDEKNDCYWAISGWYESSYEADVNWLLNQEVTHWMPLPNTEVEQWDYTVGFTDDELGSW
ncbi:hypothetical protein BK124_11435 [Paenibacillus amylolyticus]|uniref:DUF551 domain-containing protein n=1 Tax=Paenibacillus amylolyticus TaxID=1451 RepID=UPI00096C39F3|nr:DUF551 domain-containing protein [Paenibacillus amylolyticus]OMF00264.1 hypothetical protein BK124_11435 [Paenibacillus amylolyticus]